MARRPSLVVLTSASWGASEEVEAHPRSAMEALPEMSRKDTLRAGPVILMRGRLTSNARRWGEVAWRCRDLCCYRLKIDRLPGFRRIADDELWGEDTRSVEQFPGGTVGGPRSVVTGESPGPNSLSEACVERAVVGGIGSKRVRKGSWTVKGPEANHHHDLSTVGGGPGLHHSPPEARRSGLGAPPGWSDCTDRAMDLQSGLGESGTRCGGFPLCDATAPGALGLLAGQRGGPPRGPPWPV